MEDDSFDLVLVHGFFNATAEFSDGNALARMLDAHIKAAAQVQFRGFIAAVLTAITNWNITFHQSLWVETPPFRAAFRVAVLVVDVFKVLKYIG